MTLWPRWSLRFQVSQACGCRQAWAVTHWAVPTIIPSSTEGKLRHGLLGLVAVSPVERVARMPALSGAWFLSGCSLHHEARAGQLSPFLVFCKLLHRETPPPPVCLHLTAPQGQGGLVCQITSFTRTPPATDPLLSMTCWDPCISNSIAGAVLKLSDQLGSRKSSAPERREASCQALRVDGSSGLMPGTALGDAPGLANEGQERCDGGGGAGGLEGPLAPSAGLTLRSSQSRLVG